jgi:hypothetical protein
MLFFGIWASVLIGVIILMSCLLFLLYAFWRATRPSVTPSK